MSTGDDSEDTRSVAILAAGVSVSHYRIIEKIGAGGMGEVYLAEDTQLDRKVALKFLPPHLCQDADCHTRFRREAQAAARLGHANIVAVHEVGQYRGRPFFAMEFIEGTSLEKMIAKDPLGEVRAIELALGICNGLRKAHELGVIHRDVKPSNIIVDNDGVPRLLDFGLATIRDSDRLTRTGSMLGTLGYMSPEQVAGREVDARSDLFSLGVVFYEMLTGVNPFRRDNEAATLKAISEENPEPMARFASNISSDLQNVVRKLLEKQADYRYQTAADVMRDLGKLAQRSSSVDLTPAHQASIVVLPFINLSPDPEQEYFCDGIAEEVINALSHVSGLQVVARTTAFSFKGQAMDVREIGRKLGTGTVLEGSVRRFESRLRITTQLVDVATGYHLWSEKFDRELEDVFAIQDEISLAVVENLKIQLGISDRARLVKRYTDDPVAYGLYLKGRYFWNRRHQGSMKQAIAYFEEAIGKDPLYAPAHIGVADSYGQMAVWGLARPRDAFEKAKVALATGFRIDDTLAEAYLCDGWIKMFYDWDAPAAERAFLRSLELDPNSAHAHRWYSILLLALERKEECFREITRSLEIDPVLLMTNAILGLALYWCGDFEKSEAQLKKTLELESDFAPAYLFRGQNYAGMQMWDEAIESLVTYNKMTLNSPIGVGRLALVYGLAGRYPEAGAALDLLHQLSRQRFVSPLYFAMAHAGLGEHDRAFEYMNQAIKQREPWMLVIKSAPFLNCLKADPRFAGLVAKVRPMD